MMYVNVVKNLHLQTNKWQVLSHFMYLLRISASANSAKCERMRWWWCTIEVQNELDPFKPSKATTKAPLLSRQSLAWAAQIGFFYKDKGLVCTFSVCISRKCVVHSNSSQFCSSLKYKILSSITGMSGWVKWVMGWLLTFAPLTGAGAAEYGNTDAAHHPALGHFIWAFRFW